MTNNDFFKLFEDYNNRNYCKGTSLCQELHLEKPFPPE